MVTTAPAAAIVACPACGARNRVPQSRRGKVRCAKCHEALPWLVDVDDASFDEAVAGASLPVLVDVWAPWCGPCRMVAPVVESLAREFAGRLKVAKVNSDTSPGVSARHNISSIPTLLLYRDGAEADRIVGARPAAELRSWVSQKL
ncbi:thioredoxin [Gryllotalpicola ginsengisoli]|uniref:thioredoxin n=1 Tax=Gryllotalpicola ginsengisoli TaxID=444608 RepID=UPI0003B6C641|nr:thioredoxin [Gryllotalpicola ginsengisoli]